MRRQRGVIALTTWLGILLLLALAASAAGNAYLFREYEEQRDRAVAAESNLDTANQATTACKESIAGLEKAAYSRGKKAAEARAAARAKNDALARAGQRELQTPATAPGDDCKSARDRVARILRERRPP